MLGFNGDSVTYLPDKGDTLVRLICYDVPGDVMVDSFDDADFRESFAVGARGNFYSKGNLLKKRTLWQIVREFSFCKK